MLKIGYPTFGCDSGRSGIGRYAIELLRELATFKDELQIDVVGHADEKSIFAENLDVGWLSVSDFFRAPLKNILWHQFNLLRLARKRGWDALFLPAGNRRLPYFSNVATIGVVHDFSALHVANKYDQNRMFYISRVLPVLMRKLDAVVTISESSRADIMHFAGVDEKKITIIHHGVDHKRYFPADKTSSLEQINRQFGFSGPYILYISRIEHPGKNHVNLIRAFEMLKRQENLPYKLVLAGSDWDRAAEVHALAEQSEFRDQIVFTGFAKNEDLPRLVNGCDMFVFPSMYEGFGMPILEAMACRVAVACSDVSSMPEVAGNAAELFAPEDPVSIKAAMKKILADATHRAALQAAGHARAQNFTWHNTARQTFSVIKTAFERRSRRHA